MTNLAIPPEIEGPLVKEARRLGTTPEQLALETLRREFVSTTSVEGQTESTLHDFLDGYVGTVNGSSDAFSERCGERFAEGLVEPERRERS